MERDAWTKKVYEACPYEIIYPQFLRHIEPMGLMPEMIKGRVLVIGHSGAFPEKTLISTPASYFSKFRDEVESLFCCDPEFFSCPETHFDAPLIKTITMKHISKSKKGAVYFEPSACSRFLRKVESDFFDSVLMFRIVDLGTQIEKYGLIKTIAPHLKQGGYFIGSGGRFPTEVPTNFFEPLNVEKTIRLSNWSDGYPFTENTGVILRK